MNTRNLVIAVVLSVALLPTALQVLALPQHSGPFTTDLRDQVSNQMGNVGMYNMWNRQSSGCSQFHGSGGLNMHMRSQNQNPYYLYQYGNYQQSYGNMGSYDQHMMNHMYGGHMFQANADTNSNITCWQ